MRFIKTVSFLSIMTVAMSSVSYGAPMTAQIRRLLEEKEEKIKQLEQCDGKRKGWMIAGISTIGLTAVGVGVNIAQANKSNRLSDEIDNAKQELDKHQYNLSNINSEISEKEREKTEREKAEREKRDNDQGETVVVPHDTEPAPELDNHPKLGDSCQDGAGIWTEVTDSPDDAKVCIKEPEGKTSCVCKLRQQGLVTKPDSKKPSELPVNKPDADLNGLGDHAWSSVDMENCRISGGEWRYSNQLKKYECHCGTIGSYTDRHMKLTKDNTCVCQSGYVLIDENQPIKGCRLGSNQVEQDNFIKSVNTMQAKWNSMSTKIHQCEVATTNVATAGDFDKAQNFVNQAQQYASDAIKLAGDIKDLYQTITATYRELESVDKKAVSRHKESADRMKTDADNTQTIVNNYINQAQTELMRVSQKQNTTQKNMLGNACVDSHGQPDGNSCKCDASKNLIPNGPNACTCKTVGKNKYEWHDRCNMCRAPSAVDKDLPCGV